MSTTAQSGEIAAPGIKIVTAWGLVGVTSWADFASFLAAVYTLLLIGEWLFKKWLRPLAVRWGLLPPLKRRKEDRGDSQS